MASMSLLNKVTLIHDHYSGYLTGLTEAYAQTCSNIANVQNWLIELQSRQDPNLLPTIKLYTIFIDIEEIEQTRLIYEIATMQPVLSHWTLELEHLESVQKPAKPKRSLFKFFFKLLPF